MTLNGVLVIILRYFTEFDSLETIYITYCCNDNVAFGNVWLVAIFSDITEKEWVKDRYPLPESENLTNTAPQLANGEREDFDDVISKML